MFQCDVTWQVGRLTWWKVNRWTLCAQEKAEQVNQYILQMV